MNSWKNNISLFHLKPGSFSVAINGVGQYKIFGSILNKAIFINKDKEGPMAAPKDRCTLIARPILDMTEEEIRRWQGIPSLSESECADLRDVLIAKANSGALTFTEFMCLAREGIYFGPQSHFDLPDDDPAKVIDIAKLEMA